MNIHRVFIDGIFHREDWFVEALGLITPDQIPDKHVRAIYKILQHGYFNGGMTPNFKTFPDLLGRKFSKKTAEVLVQYIFAQEHRPTDYPEFKHAVHMLLVEGKRERVRSNIAEAISLLEKGNLSKIERVLVDGIDSFDNEGSEEFDSAKGVNQFLEAQKEELGPGILTGIPEIDQLTGGGRIGQSWIWAAYTGECKTTSMMEMAYYMRTHGHNVIWITLEQECDEMQEMFIVRNCHKFKDGGVDKKKAEMHLLPDEDFEVLEAAAIDWRDNTDYGRLHIWKPNRLATLNTVETKLHTLKSMMGAEVVVLDYLEMIAATQRREQYRLEVKEKMQTFKRLVSDLDLFGITGHQMNRGGWKDARKRGYYLLSDLGESAGVEQNASLVAWSLRTEELEDANQIKYGIMKYRHGARLFRGVECNEQLAQGRIAFDEVGDAPF